MIAQLLRRHLGSALLCLFAQSVASALITLNFNQHTPSAFSAHFFDTSGGYLLLDVLRIEGKMLGRAGLEALLLIGVALPLLVLAHLQLFASCARLSCPSGSQLTRPVLDALGSTLLIRALQGVCSLGCVWLGARVNMTLLHSLNAGFSWPTVGLVGVVSLVVGLALAFLGVMSDHTQLSGLLVDRQRPVWRRRFLMGFSASFIAPRLLWFRLARLLSGGLLVAGSVFISQQLASSLLSSALVQGLILLSILIEAFWYYALSQLALSGGLRPWISEAN